MKIVINTPNLSEVCKGRVNPANVIRIKTKKNSTRKFQETKKLTDEELRPEVIDTYYPEIWEMFPEG